MANLYIKGATIAVAGLVVSWFLQSDNSPLYEWLLYHVTAGNIMATVNLPAFLAAALGSGNIHAPGKVWYVSCLVAQWLLYGLAFAWLLHRLWPNNSFKPRPLRGSA